MAAFPGEAGSAGTPWFLLLHLFWDRTSGITGTVVVRDRYPSCQSTTSVKAVNGTQSTNSDQWSDCIFLHPPSDSQTPDRRGVAGFILALDASTHMHAYSYTHIYN